MENNRKSLFHYMLLFYLSLKVTGSWISLFIADLDLNFYIISLIKEAVLVCFCVFFVFNSRQVHIFRRRGSGILKGVRIGFFPFFMGTVTLIINLFLEEAERRLQPWYVILAFFLCMICVGTAEELFFRGIVAEILFERLAVGRKGIWKAVILSGAMFGLFHLINLSFGNPIGVFVQVIGATVSGMVFTAIYYRSGNIWTVVLLHSYQDMAALALSGIYGFETAKDAISDYEPIKLIGMVPYIIVLLVLLRKRKLEEVERNMKTE
ncbi:MAG: CPBP family intramembrane metalloprotease [Roseburia sp.]|nr:CPBP family intramembrane metalloprotease [Roseburia sp.]MCM1278573.1 CPBP family intramembrane metalloprotease [Robinsoniella sp.]